MWVDLEKLLKAASQSSLSKWSKENDAQRTVIGFDLLKKKIEELKAQ